MSEIELKIGREIYTITPDDKFLDNGACIQLLTQPIKKGFRSYRPVLSKRAARELQSQPHTRVKATDKLSECYYIQLNNIQ